MTLRRTRSMIDLALRLGTTTLMVSGLAGCNPMKPAATPPSSTQAPKLETRSIGRPLSEEECLAYGKALTKAIQSGDAAGFNQMIDWQAINDRTVAGIDAPEKFRHDFIKGIAQAEVSERGIAGVLVDIVKNGGTYTLLRSHRKDGRTWLLFRLLQAGGGMNYHDLPLARRADGKIKALDIHVYLSGEPISQTFRRGYIQALAGSNASLIDRLTGMDRTHAENFKQMGEMGKIYRDGKFEEALALYNGVSPSLKQDKMMLILRIQAALNLGKDDEYMRAVEDCRKFMPDDPCIDILSVDYFFMKKRYKEAIETVDRLDKAVQGDPYLQSMKANLHAEAGDLAAARAILNAAIQDDSGLIDLYWALIGVSLKDNNYDETLKTLRIIRDRFRIDPGDLASEDLYKGFVASPQYQEWLKENREAGPADGEAAKGQTEGSPAEATPAAKDKPKP